MVEVSLLALLLLEQIRLFGNVVAINSSRIISNEADIGGGISKSGVQCS